MTSKEKKKKKYWDIIMTLNNRLNIHINRKRNQPK